MKPYDDAYFDAIYQKMLSGTELTSEEVADLCQCQKYDTIEGEERDYDRFDRAVIEVGNRYFSLDFTHSFCEYGDSYCSQIAREVFPEEKTIRVTVWNDKPSNQ